MSTSARAGLRGGRPAGVPASRPRERITGLHARLRSGQLDRALAAGTPSWESPLHAARARQITGERSRRALADALDRIVELAEAQPASTLASPVISPDRAAVVQTRPLLGSLAERLRSRAAIDARGAALLRCLLTDCCSELYAAASPALLANQLLAVDELLDTATGT